MSTERQPSILSLEDGDRLYVCEDGRPAVFRVFEPDPPICVRCLYPVEHHVLEGGA